MPRLAIVIPFAGNPQPLEETLVSVLENRPGDCEILVCGRPYADPYEIEGEVRLLPGPRRCGLMAGARAAVAATEAPVIHVLRCGTTVVEGWADAALAALADPRIAAVAPLVLDAGDPETILAAGVDYGAGGQVRALRRGAPLESLPRAVRPVLAAHPAAAFYRREVLQSVGKLAEEVGSQVAALEIALAMRQLGLRTVLAPQSRVLAAPRRGLAHTVGEAFQQERLFWRWLGVEGRLRGLAMHALFCLGECFAELPGPSTIGRLLGRTLGACLPRKGRDLPRRLRALREELSQPAASKQKRRAA